MNGQNTHPAVKVKQRGFMQALNRIVDQYPTPLIYRRHFYSWWCRHRTIRGDKHGNCWRCSAYYEENPCGLDDNSNCLVCLTMTAEARHERAKRIRDARSSGKRDTLISNANKERFPAKFPTQLHALLQLSAEAMEATVRYYYRVTAPKSRDPDKWDYTLWYENWGYARDMAYCAAKFDLPSHENATMFLMPDWLDDHLCECTQAAKAGAPMPELATRSYKATTTAQTLRSEGWPEDGYAKTATATDVTESGDGDIHPNDDSQVLLSLRPSRAASHHSGEDYTAVSLPVPSLPDEITSPPHWRDEDAMSLDSNTASPPPWGQPDFETREQPQAHTAGVTALLEAAGVLDAPTQAFQAMDRRMAVNVNQHHAAAAKGRCDASEPLKIKVQRRKRRSSIAQQPIVKKQKLSSPTATCSTAKEEKQTVKNIEGESLSDLEVYVIHNGKRVLGTARSPPTLKKEQDRTNTQDVATNTDEEFVDLTDDDDTHDDEAQNDSATLDLDATADTGKRTMLRVDVYDDAREQQEALNLKRAEQQELARLLKPQPPTSDTSSATEDYNDEPPPSQDVEDTAEAQSDATAPDDASDVKTSAADTTECDGATNGASYTIQENSDVDTNVLDNMTAMGQQTVTLPGSGKAMTVKTFFANASPIAQQRVIAAKKLIDAAEETAPAYQPAAMMAFLFDPAPDAPQRPVSETEIGVPRVPQLYCQDNMVTIAELFLRAREAEFQSRVHATFAANPGCETLPYMWEPTRRLQLNPSAYMDRLPTLQSTATAYPDANNHPKYHDAISYTTVLTVADGQLSYIEEVLRHVAKAICGLECGVVDLIEKNNKSTDRNTRHAIGSVTIPTIVHSMADVAAGVAEALFQTALARRQGISERIGADLTSSIHALVMSLFGTVCMP